MSTTCAELTPETQHFGKLIKYIGNSYVFNLPYLSLYKVNCIEYLPKKTDFAKIYNELLKYIMKRLNILNIH